MTIIGKGLIAKSFVKFRKLHKNVLILASGVSNSLETSQKEFLRERNLLEETLVECKRNRLQLVYCSSAGAVYGTTKNPAKETDTPAPHNLYGHKKVEFEKLIRESGCSYLICRLPNLLGKNQNPNQLFPSLMHQIHKKNVTVFTRAYRDLLDITDFTRALIDLLNLDYNYETINIVSGISTSARDLILYIKKATKSNCCPKYVNKGERHQFSNAKLRSLIPWTNNYFDKNYYGHIISKYLKFYKI